MTRASLSEYGRAHGVTKQSASKWKRDGLLVLDGDLVDVEASDKRLSQAGKGRFGDKGRHKPRNPAAAALKPAPKPPLWSPVYDPDEDDDGDVQLAAEELAQLEDFETEIRAGRFLGKGAADQVKANALALRQLVAAKKAAGALVDIETAEQALFEASRSARDAWLNFPARVGPLIAADLNIEADKVVDVLTAHVHEQLAQLGEPDVRFGADDSGGEAQPSLA